jgi:glutathione S-transferase
MLKIWGRLTSVNVQKVVWTADELGLEYERLDAGGAFGIVQTPEYKAMNPNSLVPVIEDDGFVLWESNAIARYLAAKSAATTFWPADVRLRADVDRWMDWQATTFTPAMRDAFWQLIRTPAQKRDSAVLGQSIEASEKAAALLDAHLEGREFVAGDAFTLADIVNGCATHRWLGLPCEKVRRPNLERWYGTLKSRPASRQVTSLALS